MPVFCDVSAEEQIDALTEFFKSKNAKLSVTSSENIVDSLNDLIKNLDFLYNSDMPEADLEMVLNSLLSLIIISPIDKIFKLVTTFCESIVKTKLHERFDIVKLRVLSNLFHGLMSNSKDRYIVYMHLAKCSLLLKNLEYLPTKLDVVKKYFQIWQSTTEEIQALYRLLFDVLSQMNDSTNALKVVIELLGTFNKDNASKSRDDAHKCIVYCINDPNIFVFDSLLLLEPIKYLEGELIHNLFTIFVSGKLNQYMEFYEAHKTFVSQTGMNHEKNIDKLRILTLMTLAENNKELPFETLQKQLKIEADEIESFVIDAIRTKCVRCKIDHLTKTVTIMSVSYRTFTKQHWQVLKERLEKWKENLTLVNQNLTNLLSSPAMIQA
jgi:translation initiation factor 3 subunit M